MKPSRSFALTVGLLLGLASACSSDPKNALGDPHSFAGMNAAAISYDCSQTLICLQMNNMQTDAQFQNNGEQMEGDQLNRYTDKQPGFLEAATRCAQRSGCEYTNCTTTKPTGYGQQQMDKVTYICSQKIQCEIDQGHSPSNPQQAVNNCVGEKIGELFLYSTKQRSDFELAWPPCTSLTTCAFVQCFPY